MELLFVASKPGTRGEARWLNIVTTFFQTVGLFGLEAAMMTMRAKLASRSTVPGHSQIRRRL